MTNYRIGPDSHHIDLQKEGQEYQGIVSVYRQ